MDPKTILLSIRPIHAKRIFNGTKRVELRRSVPSLSTGDTVFVYVSSPVKELQGRFCVERVVEAPLEDLWAYVKDDAGISKEEFDDYFEGANIGHGIFLSAPTSIRRPIGLDELRKLWSGFHPPQNFRYLDTALIQRVSAFVAQTP